VTRVQFLHGAANRLAAAADWLREAGRAGRRVVVLAPDGGLREQLDRQLWAQPATGFLPHCRIDSPLAPETPIVFAAGTEEVPHHDCLLNLGNGLPTNFARFAELVEIVSVDDADRLPARERFKHYRERGYELVVRDIGQDS
jgi:DNA polymerase-3 subunit chi